MQYFVYILANETNVAIYIGVTNNLVRRVYEHKNKIVKGFTEKYNINRLVYYEIASTPTVAIEREKQLKSWSRKKKNELIHSFNPEWDDLYYKIAK